MRLAPFALAILALPTLALAPACRRQEEPPPPPPPAAPISMWSQADSQAIAAQLVESATRDVWSSQFRDRNSRAATIAVGEITDRSGHNVPIDSLTAAITAAPASGGGDKLASGGDSSDYILSGVIAASTGTTADGAAATFFAVDLSLSERSSGDKIWPFAVERPITSR